MIIHFSTVAFDVVVFGGAFCDFEIGAGDDDVGGAGAAGPFLAVEAVAAVNVLVWLGGLC